MRHSLHSHIIYLENLIQGVKSRLTLPGLPPEEIEDLQLQLTLAESALEHYRQAYALELTAAGSEPPQGPAGLKPSEGTGSPGKSKTDEGEGRLTAVGVPVKERLPGKDRATRVSGLFRGLQKSGRLSARSGVC